MRSPCSTCRRRPKSENQGRFLRRLAAAAPAVRRWRVLLDESQFARRFAGLGLRLAERREAWRLWGERARHACRSPWRSRGRRPPMPGAPAGRLCAPASAAGMSADRFRPRRQCRGRDRSRHRAAGGIGRRPAAPLRRLRHRPQPGLAHQRRQDHARPHPAASPISARCATRRTSPSSPSVHDDRHAEGDALLLWDTPGFGDSVRLAKRLRDSSRSRSAGS